ncbi:MAG: N-acetylmuramoyl-L-alanine amidase [Oscillospiraceae bacterium]|nr:N-acetylmuramoyl-L-alanine amidase [Oscillospiraceae bacterium]
MTVKTALVSLLAATAFISKPCCIIDAGHGGEDGGAVAPDGTVESELNLSICLKLDALMGLFGAEAVLTRSSDAIDYPADALTVRERKNADQQRRAGLIASRENAILISVHQNSFVVSGPSGAQVLYGDHDGSRELAACIHRFIGSIDGQKLRPYAEVPDDIFLMRSAECPAVLVECGFLSNGEDLARLEDDGYRTKLAIALCAAYIDYLSGPEDTNG